MPAMRKTSRANFIVSVLRQCAECALGESLRLQAEGVIEARAVVLPRDGRRQLHQLGSVEFGPQPGEQRVGDVHGSPRHFDGELDDESLAFREKLAEFESSKFAQLLLAHARCPADGRADVDSERTSDHCGGFDSG